MSNKPKSDAAMYALIKNHDMTGSELFHTLKAGIHHSEHAALRRRIQIIEDNVKTAAVRLARSGPTHHQPGARK